MAGNTGTSAIRCYLVDQQSHKQRCYNGRAQQYCTVEDATTRGAACARKTNGRSTEHGRQEGVDIS